MQPFPDPLNAFVAGTQGADIEEKSGPLAGLLLAVKDIFAVRGQKTGGGNPQMLAEAQPAASTAPAIRALLDAGARFVGRTQTDELTFSLMGHNAHYPQPVNPVAPGRVTGGSSSGSAAAVAGGLADIAAGSDTGGSIRAPASFCGLIGLRTTHGAIPLDGAMPLAPSLDTFGWFARDAEIYERVGSIFFGEAGAAPHPYPLPVKDGERESPTLRPTGGGKLEPALTPDEGQFRLLRLAALDALPLGEAEAAEYRRMLRKVEAALGPSREASPLARSLDDLYWCFRRIQAFEAWQVHGPFISAKDRRLGPGVRERFEFGRTIDAATFARESERRAAFRAGLADLLGEDGLLVLPTVPGAAPLRDAGFDDQQAYRERALRLLCLSGPSGFPQITIPLGRVAGAPFGISLLGPAGSDLQLIRLARIILDATEKV
ncbi:MAG: amidase [Rhizobiales bacterium 68-8]|nr:MAG: amidase [Rhizobiales bacterium 68-8]